MFQGITALTKYTLNGILLAIAPMESTSHCTVFTALITAFNGHAHESGVERIVESNAE
jgi:hypothetical protein